MTMTILSFLTGLVGLYFGGDWLVRGASDVARRFRVSPLVIGLTVVGFGTSTPELLVSVQAALNGQGGIAIGNVVGSNIANILIILGLSAVVAPLVMPFARIRGDLVWMIGVGLLLIPMFMTGVLTRLEGAILFAGIVVYILIALRQVGTEAHDDQPVPAIWKSAALIAGGLIALMVGAHFLVDSATKIAQAMGVSEAVIGLTIVAIGTSLPELATSVTAAMRGQREIAIGNVVGSNVFNVLAILGATALIAPVPVEARFLAIDLPVMIGVSLLLTAILWATGGVGRIVGVLFLLGYGVYVALLGATG
jgi:cation:H+ antiporter